MLKSAKRTFKNLAQRGGSQVNPFKSVTYPAELGDFLERGIFEEMYFLPKVCNESERSNEETAIRHRKSYPVFNTLCTELILS